MENTNTNAEVISQNVLADIFKEFEPTQEETPPAQETNEAEQEIENLLKPPVAQETPKAEEPVKTITDYSKRLKNIISDGLIENFAITYNEQEVYLEDIEDLTEEGYNQILESYKSEKEKSLKEKYISTDNLDDQTKKLIEIKQAGGDISEIIRENVTAIEQVQGLKARIDEENIQAYIVGTNLKQKGLSDRAIKSEIAALVDQGELEAEATTILDGHLSLHTEAIEQKRLSQLERVEKEKEENKNLRKTLSATYKEFGVPDNIQRVLVDNATKLDQDKISNTDKLYFEAIKDPKKFAEINYFLNNPEEFKKWVSSKKVLEAKTNQIKPLFTVNINNQKKPKLSATSLEEYADEILNNHK